MPLASVTGSGLAFSKMVTNLLLTGKPGVGKTTVVEQVVKSLSVPVGGFYTREIRERGKRVGFRLTTWTGRACPPPSLPATHIVRQAGLPAPDNNGGQAGVRGRREGIMSHIDFVSPFRVGKYGVDIRVINNIGIPAIREAITLCKIIVIDELGRMELFSETFQEAVWEALEKKLPLLGVIQERPHPFLNRVRKRPDVELIPVTIENRNTLVDKLSHRLSNIL